MKVIPITENNSIFNSVKGRTSSAMTSRASTRRSESGGRSRVTKKVDPLKKSRERIFDSIQGVMLRYAGVREED
jgi:hypothetical protein